jgi:hypothetical protein
MAKFKKGDRVRNIVDNGVLKYGATGTVAEDDQSTPWVIWDSQDMIYNRFQSSSLRFGQRQEYLQPIEPEKTGTPTDWVDESYVELPKQEKPEPAEIYYDATYKGARVGVISEPLVLVQFCDGTVGHVKVSELNKVMTFGEWCDKEYIHQLDFQPDELTEAYTRYQDYLKGLESSES